MNEHGWTPSEQLAVCQKEKNVAHRLSAELDTLNV